MVILIILTVCNAVTMGQHFKGHRKSVDGGGSKPIAMAFYGGGLYPAVDLDRLMIMKMIAEEVNLTEHADDSH